MFLLALVFPARAWWFGAHSLVAQLGLEMLTHEQRLYLAKLFSMWNGEEASPIEAALWQDNLKDSKLYIMSNWHFCDKPVLGKGYVLQETPVHYNITNALTEGIASLMMPTTTSLWSLQFTLRNLLHFVGDIHQPLHSSSLFSEEFPEGDQGGNKIKLKCKYGAACDNLHFMWDSALLSYQFNDSETVYVDFMHNISRIKEKYPPRELGLDADNLDPMNMNTQANEVAVNFAYGALRDDREITEEYLVQGRVFADKMISLAGHRLGLILQKFFASRKLVPLVKTPPFSVREGIAWGIDACLVVLIVVYSVLVVRQSRLEDEKLMLQYS